MSQEDSSVKPGASLREDFRLKHCLQINLCKQKVTHVHNNMENISDESSGWFTVIKSISAKKGTDLTFKWPQKHKILEQSLACCLDIEVELRLKDCGILREVNNERKDIRNLVRAAQACGKKIDKKNRVKISFDRFLSRGRPGLKGEDKGNHKKGDKNKEKKENPTLVDKNVKNVPTDSDSDIKINLEGLDKHKDPILWNNDDESDKTIKNTKKINNKKTKDSNPADGQDTTLNLENDSDDKSSFIKLNKLKDQSHSSLDNDYNKVTKNKRKVRKNKKTIKDSGETSKEEKPEHLDCNYKYRRNFTYLVTPHPSDCLDRAF